MTQKQKSGVNIMRVYEKSNLLSASVLRVNFALRPKSDLCDEIYSRRGCLPRHISDGVY